MIDTRKLPSNNIQLLRGLAIIAVVFIHNTPIGMSQIFIRPFINFAVALFLFLSGILTDINRWNPRKRLIKVLIPYILWTFIYCVLRTCKTPTQIPLQFIKMLFTASGAAVMYYIWVYCQFTLFTPIMDKLAKSRYKYIGFCISPLEIIIMRLIPLIMGFEWNSYISIMMSVSCLGWFSYN